MNPDSSHLILALLSVPGCVVLLFGTLWFLGLQLTERFITRVTSATCISINILCLILLWRLLSGDSGVLTAQPGHWFSIGHYGFPLSFRIDNLAMPLVLLTTMLSGTVGAFSARYLHRDPGFFRFFLLLHLFTFGSLLLFTANSLDLLIAGWEIVGITSVLLIGFFQYRRDPAKNALRVFGTYRIADLGLLIAVFLSHHTFGASDWNGMISGTWPSFTARIDGPVAVAMTILLIFAASGKSAQGPFCGWLARAMEGPTPSSAIFYGAISIHAGAYLLLRVQPLIVSSSTAAGLVIFIGATTALLSTLVHRTCADAKTSLAYAAQTQVGLIFVEIGLGWTQFAMFHLCSHALLRTLQLLRTPSMLRDHHRIHAAAGGQRSPTGEHYESILPRSVQIWLYRVALGRGFYDAIVDRFILTPVTWFARTLAAIEPGGRPKL
jgi:NAD(P)H-quinone oxidoreductase subunit 5